MTDKSDSELLARIDERTEAMMERMKEFVTQDEFGPVKAVLIAVLLRSATIKADIKAIIDFLRRLSG